MLLDGDPWLRFAAVEALGRIADARAARPLVATLRDELIAERSLEALARIAEPDVLYDVLELLLDEDRRPFRPAALSVVAATLERRGRPAARALRRFAARVGATAALHDSLTECLRGDDAEQARAAAALVIAIPVRTLFYDVIARVDLAWVAAMLEHVHPEPSVAIARLLASSEASLRVAGLALLPARESARRIGPLLDDPDVGVRVAACDAIARGTLAAFVPVLVARLVATPIEHAAAKRALAVMPGAKLRALAPMLASEARATSLGAALEILASARSRLFGARVRALASHRDAAVRRAAVRALSVRIDVASTRALVARLADPEPSVAIAAVDALADSSTPEAWRSLAEVVRVAGPLRYRAVLALSRGGADEAAALEHAYADAAPHERVEIVAGVARIGARRSAAFLRERVAS
jgi:hypothetical protein